MKDLAPPTSDSVSDALRTLGVRSSVFCLSELRAPWAFRVAGAHVPKFHLVLAGSAHLRIDGRPEGSPPLTAHAGDLILLLRGQPHTLADGHKAGAKVGAKVGAQTSDSAARKADDQSSAVPLEEILRDHPLDQHARLRYGGAGALTRLLCGGFALADEAPSATLALMPDVMRVEAKTVASAAWLEPLLAMLNAEATRGTAGAGAIVTKLADVFLAQALRAWLVDQERQGVHVHGLLRDQPIGKAVEALYHRPFEPWTLDRLASHVGLARTALASRFHQLVGQPPMRYLTRVRLGRAAQYLAAGQRTVSEIAHLSGYDDAAAFSKAFKRTFGHPPGAYRKLPHTAPAIATSPYMASSPSSAASSSQ